MHCLQFFMILPRNKYHGPLFILLSPCRPLSKDMTGTKLKIIEWLLSLPDDAVISAEIFKPKRSKKQNAYFWVLVTEIANVMKQSKNVIYNTLLRDYGQPLTINGERPYIFIPDTEEAEAEVMRAETYHLKPTGHIKEGKGEVNYRAYYPLLGSSEYDTAQMSVLLDGAIQEAKALDIETLTPEEIERMREEDRRIEERRRKKQRAK